MKTNKKKKKNKKNKNHGTLQNDMLNWNTMTV
jgi:hypothetical protein